MFIYLNDLKRNKLFFKLNVYELIISGILLVTFIIYSANILNLKPLIFPLSYITFTVRLFEDDTNLFFHLKKVISYFVAKQQTFFWGSIDD
jgi:hypothetical protein